MDPVDPDPQPWRYRIFWDAAGDTLVKLGYSTDYEILQSILFSLYMSVFGTITGKDHFYWMP